MKPKHNDGFTLIEILVTLTIMLVLASITLPLAEMAVKRNREQELKAALWEIRAGLDAYKKAADEERIAKEDSQSGYPESLELLISGVEDIKSPKKNMIYFLRRIPRDPFYADQTEAPERMWGKRSYASPPDDPKEGEDIFDVFSLSDKVGINGVPYKDW